LSPVWPPQEGRQPSSPFGQPPPFIILESQSVMEHWEETKLRSIVTLPVWRRLTPERKIGTLGFADLDAMINSFEPLAQARTLAQDDYDAAYRAMQESLARMKLLGTKVPVIIEGLLDENPRLMKNLQALYATTPRTEETILKRARELYPVWRRANQAQAALTPSQEPITRFIGGMMFTAAMLKSMVEDYPNLVEAVAEAGQVLEDKRAALQTLDRMADRLNKRWYKVVKASCDEGSELFRALQGIPKETGTAKPQPVEIANVTQGGTGGLQVLVAYVEGGGKHATTKQVKWQVVGTDTGFGRSAPWAAEGNALGPFEEGQTVQIITEMSNSSGRRTTAPRTIKIGSPLT